MRQKNRGPEIEKWVRYTLRPSVNEEEREEERTFSLTTRPYQEN
jgi:hypothetical protein